MNGLMQEDAAVGASLVVVTMDDSLIQTLEAVAPDHPLSVLATEADLPAFLLGEEAGVLVIDTAAITTPVARLTERLAAQFPELVLIVAGDSEDQAALTAQVTRGTVYRFLRKPASAQRVKLFVEAAWRRHDEGSMPMTATRARAAAPPEPRLSRSTLMFGAAAVAAAVAVAMWFELRPVKEPAPAATVAAESAPAAAPASADPELERLLAKGDEAFERGALLGPPNQNAVAYYRQALQRDNANVRAREGLGRVTERLLSGAEQALLAEKIEDAARLVDQARALEPANVRVAFLGAQIDKERERAVLAKARGAAASGDINRAVDVLDDAAARAGGRSGPAAETRQPLAGQRVDERVANFLNLANERIRSGDLIEPAQNNARYFVESAAAIAPDDPLVREAERDLAKRLVAQARTVLTAGNLAESERWIAIASEAGAAQDDLTALRRDVQTARIAAKAESMARLSQLFNQRLAEGELLEPSNDSARYYLRQLELADATHPSTRLARSALSGRLLEEARTATVRGDLAAAQAFVTDARNLGVNAASAAAVEREIAAARMAPARTESGPISAGRLERIRYVPPEFPMAARQRNLSGSVELEYTVRADGRVTDVKVVSSTPPKIFDDAATDAVRKWRYKPYERDGRAVDQRVKVILRFAME